MFEHFLTVNYIPHGVEECSWSKISNFLISKIKNMYAGTWDWIQIDETLKLNKNLFTK